MKERPILFSGSMVRAILAGTKTQTRRVVKHKIIGPNPPTGIFDWHHPRTDEWMGAHGGGIKFGLTNAARLCPYGQPGDRLWVREAFYVGVEGGPIYRACIDQGLADFVDAVRKRYGEKWVPSIHMPRWASRILLEIVGVRVERLQDINEWDAIDEGVGGDVKVAPCFAVERYRALWESINGPGSWDANPWVWVVEFKRVTP